MKLSIFINIVTISIPLLIAWSTYKLSKIDDGGDNKKRKYNRITYYSSVAIIILTIGLLLLNQQENKSTIEENKSLNKKNRKLLDDNKQLLKDSKSLYDDQKNLFNENVKISNDNKGLLIKIDELKEIVTQKDEKIDELKKQVNNIELSAPKIDNQGRIATSPFVTMASEFSEGIAASKAMYNKGDLDGAYKKAEEIISKKNDFGLAYFMRGTVLAAKGNYNDALIDLKKAVNYGLDKSDLAWCYHNMAISELNLNKLQNAYDYFIKCYETDTNFTSSKDIFEKLKIELKK